ncbi:MAG TPA: hypothetical protein VMJ35_03810 [Dongiaceae bacterium]|nr:hypothetical protein [Dongiaceae bacterium]
MPVTTNASTERFLNFLRNPAVRVGIYVGVGLSVVFVAWIVVANRLPQLEVLATERNIVTAAVLILLAAAPVLRFLRSPAEMLASGLLAWGIFTLTYKVLCSVFPLLEENYTAFHVCVMGTISYLIFATLSWVASIVWRVRATKHSHNHH